MSLDGLSMNQALGIWAELVEAYHGVNGYGGDTAELYAYRFMRRDPSAEVGHGNMGREAKAERAKEAAGALFSILSKFQKERECHIWVNDQEFEAWVKDIVFDWRVAVRVLREQDVRKGDRRDDLLWAALKAHQDGGTLSKDLAASIKKELGPSFVPEEGNWMRHRKTKEKEGTS